ncbi:hypothetical protein L207DRAFT_571820 [Hyaloscypha variabilis F]|uniref:Uncharacterized protein n=1 Tax=Hyaloscypha variabilis (strain UAMH 11265 / GT02V1 / F) TaxID=1149755 RepID=A0A2J6R3K5_HYAVF|nr:hypothetical protein L207DRAFT_571820 [Hyaloscypha variabilis F]
MFFKKLRSRSKASTKPSIERITSVSSSREHNKRDSSKVPAVMVSPPTNELTERLAAHENLREGEERSDDEERDYQVFLEEARKAEERAERKKIAEIKFARQVNLSPWGGRM